MSEERGGLQRQIEEMQGRIASLESTIKGLANREAQVYLEPQVRIGETIKVSQGGYPPEDTGATAFGVRFRDPVFSEDDGPQSLGGDFLSDEFQRVALTIPPSYIPEGTPVMVVEFDGRFYIVGTSAALNEATKTHDCICEEGGLIDVLVEEEAISEDAETRLRVKCCDEEEEEEPEAGAPCTNCDGPTPKSLQFSISGAVGVGYGNAGAPPNVVIDALVSYINETVQTLPQLLDGITGQPTPCKYLVTKSVTSGSFDYTVQYVVTFDSLGVIASVTVLDGNRFPPVNSEAVFLDAGTPPYDCAARRNPALNDQQTFDSFAVDLSSAVVEIFPTPLPPPPEKFYNELFSCPQASGGVMPAMSFTIRGLTDTATEPQYNGWANYLNGVWEFDHRENGANGYGSVCEPAIWIKVPDNSREGLLYPRGPFVVIFQPRSPEGPVALRMLDNSQDDSRELVYYENSSNLLPVGSDGKPLTASTYSDWIAGPSADSGLTAWLANGTFTINPIQ